MTRRRSSARRARAPRLVRFSNRPAFRNARNRRRLLSVLRTLERALPVPEIEQQFHDQRPDLVLITPLVYLGSSQLKNRARLWPRAAYGLLRRQLGSPSKALTGDMPHRVIVWNETQKQEAVQLQCAGRSRHRHRRPML